MKRILITGSNGYIGNLLLQKCASAYGSDFDKIIALDIRPPAEKLKNIDYIEEDIRSKGIDRIIFENKITTVVHLAAIISIAGTHSRNYEYDVDVNGSVNLINACVKHGVDTFITTSSGAAYGYWPSNTRMLLTEEMATKGNVEIPYSYHKWLVEQKLIKVGKEHPSMQQFVFRVGTILGKTTKNPITDYLNKPTLLGLRSYESPFVAIWDQDLVAILFQSITDNKRPGIYNVAGDGPIPTAKLATLLGKKYRAVPALLLKLAFGVLRPFRLVKYGPESVKFIQYRPVLDNTKLKTIFGYIPEKTTKEVFLYWLQNNLYVSK